MASSWIVNPLCKLLLCAHIFAVGDVIFFCRSTDWPLKKGFFSVSKYYAALNFELCAVASV